MFPYFRTYFSSWKSLLILFAEAHFSYRLHRWAAYRIHSSPVHFPKQELPAFLNEALDCPDPFTLNTRSCMVSFSQLNCLQILTIGTITSCLNRACITLMVVHTKRQPFLLHYHHDDLSSIPWISLPAPPTPHRESQCYPSLMTSNLSRFKLTRDYFNFQNIRSFNLKNQLFRNK